MPTLLPLLLVPLQVYGSEFAALTLLALLQGLTEFLPVSSSGHLVLAQAALGMEEAGLALDVSLHLGTLLAVVVVYRKALLKLLQGALRGEWREPLFLVVGSVPAGVVGVFFGDVVEGLFHSARAASIGLFVTAAMLLVGESARRRHRAAGAKPRAMTLGIAVAIGCAQALAVVPGISRSGSTIALGLLCGLAPKQAARFSFLLSLPAILGAAVLKLPDAAQAGFGGDPGLVIWAALFAGFVGWGALRMLLAFLGRGAFGWFAVYCVALGVGGLVFA